MLDKEKQTNEKAIRLKRKFSAEKFDNATFKLHLPTFFFKKFYNKTIFLMYNFTKYAFGVMLVAASFMLNAQTVVFSENFNASVALPAGWQSIDNDGLTNDPTFVSQWGNSIAGWDIDVYSTGNNAAFSTSWYNPTGTSDDWLITPAIAIPANASLSWKARSLDPSTLDAYEVRVATTNTVVGFMATTPIYTNAAELGTLTTRTSSLAAYSGQTVYIAFRNVSNDKFVLVLDDVQVLQLAGTDSRIDSSSFPSRYSSIPFSQVTPLTLSARVLNNGAGTVTNVAIKTEVIELSNGNAVVFSNTSTPVASLASGSRTNMLTPTAAFTPADTGLFLIRYSVQMTETQGSTTGDTVSYALLVSDSLYGRDYAFFTGLSGSSLSIGVDTLYNKSLGTIYEVVKNAVVVDAEFAVMTPATGGARVGDTIRVILHSVGGNGAPGGRIGQSALYTITAADTVGGFAYLKIPLQTPVNVAAGTRFLIAVTEPRFARTALATSTAIFTPSTFIVNFNGWTAIDQFIQSAFVLRANLGKSCHTLAVTTTNAVCGQSTGSATVTPTPAGSYTYTWSVAGSTNTITNQPSGAYQVTVSDGQGCNVTATANINSTGGPAITNTTKVDVNCFGQSTGTATVTATGTNVTYKWSTSPQQTTATATGLAAGQYTVTVTDAQSCITTSTVTITQPATAVSGTVTKVADVSCNGGNNGKAVAAGSGGTAGYSYSWSSTPAQNTDSLLNVGNGNYTVTITDSKGCTNTLGVAIAQPASAVSATIVNKTDATGGQSNGTATVSATGGTGPYTYSWSGSASTSSSVNNLANGAQSVTVRDSRGCTTTVNFTLGSVGISDKNEIFSLLNVFPIPASSVLNIKADLKNTESMTIEMMDVAGKVVYTTEVAAANNHIIAINVNKFAKGIYTVSLKTKSGNAYQQVVVE